MCAQCAACTEYTRDGPVFITSSTATALGSKLLPKSQTESFIPAVCLRVVESEAVRGWGGHAKSGSAASLSAHS